MGLGSFNESDEIRGEVTALLAERYTNYVLLAGTHTHIYRCGIERTLQLVGQPKDAEVRCGVLGAAAAGMRWKPAGLMALWQRLFAGRTHVLCCPLAFVNLLLGYLH
jgi:hypothetical protein